MEFISICFISFIFLFSLSMSLFFLGLNFLVYDLVYFFEWEIFSINSTMMVMVLIFDWISLLFMSFVLFIAALVIYYSKDYMSGEQFINRFIILVLLFVFSMMMMILSPNLISILLGWDGLGLVSYCLVIYYQNVKSYNAGMLTALSNRLGDVALLMSIAWMLNYGSWNFLFYIEFMKGDFPMTIICSMAILAAMTKSAQIPFSSWLPAAMAAPTPVSALVHSSTLVTAGVYLLIRFSSLFADTNLGKFLLLISGLTMFMAGLGANFEFDLKKIIALSTLSQLGLMMSILAMGFYKLAFFHLLTHALFKALLFMCAGAIIHNMKNSQDIRDMGSLTISMPLTISCLNVANLALCGFPFLAGFYSKDMILEMVLISELNLFSVFLFFFSTGLTVSYSFRLFYYSFIMTMNQSSMNILNDKSFVMFKSMFGLLVFAISGGSMLNWMIFPYAPMICLPLSLKLLTLTVCIIGGLFGYLVSNVNFFSFNKSLNYYLFSFFSSSMWFMPPLSTIGVTYYPLSMSFKLFKNLDQGWLEFFGIQQMFKIFMKVSSIVQFVQFNNLKIHLTLFVFWVIFLMLLVIMI
ncbi:NADH dehydrogenase subunit 5 (mitochondrion) [Chironomus tepperi]|uniref:NADH-ubiquinone oxidoreductase chain 5 n=1 Tax=Chironomus tepperi TaxID=113505 RepID=G8J8H1_9DIPT|nr:NADH dehydrogenase subunit 5 [Chironomus tepperi]AET13089.1 NADH dehydrogenase subunit 5 [Chironomus tepperi]